MNDRQKLFVVAWTFLCTAQILFPPWLHSGSYTFSFITDPPSQYGCFISFPVLALLLGALTVFFGGLFFASRGEK